MTTRRRYGDSMPARSCSSDVWHEPLGPSSEKNSPAPTAKSTRSTAVTEPNRFSIPSSFRTASLIALDHAANGKGTGAPGCPGAPGRTVGRRPIACGSACFDLGPDALPLLGRGRRVELVKPLDRIRLVEEQRCV